MVSTASITSSSLLYATLSVLLASQHSSVRAQAPTAGPTEAPLLPPVQAASGECGSVLLAIGSYNDISWIDPPVSGEGVSIMNLTLCGTAATPNATIVTDLRIGVADAGGNPGYCDQFNATTILCSNEVPEGSVSMLDLSSTAPPKLFGLNASDPVYVELLSNGLVATANYGGSSFTTFNPMEDNSSAVIQTVEVPLGNATMGLGNIVRQEAPHPHMTYAVSDGEILVADLGSDAVYQYSVTPDGQMLWEGVTNTTAGDGPRHIAVGKMGKVYVVAELSQKILELDTACEVGAIGAARGICAETLIPEPTDGTVYLTAAALRVSKDQEFVYASMRREEQILAPGGIVGYKVESNGSLGELVGAWESGGQQPRDFAIVDVPGFKEVFVVANRKSNSVDVLDRDATTGEVGEKLVSAVVNSPTSVLVLENVTSTDIDGSAFVPVVSTAMPIAAAPLAGVPMAAAAPGPVDGGVADSGVSERGITSGNDAETAIPLTGAEVQNSAASKVPYQGALVLVFAVATLVGM